jgi:hypothetical protein
VPLGIKAVLPGKDIFSWLKGSGHLIQSERVRRVPEEHGDGDTGKRLDLSRRSAESKDFEAGLRGKIVGQDGAVQAVVDLYQVFLAGLNSPGRPVGNLLFLGPTGAGKTRVVEATAEVLFGDPRAVIKVDCAEFQHSHEIAKLIGSPPGYLGHRETRQLITQEGLAQYHTEKLKISFSSVRRNRESLGRAVAVAAGDSRQSHADLGRQPAGGPVADNDIHDLESGRRGNHGVDDRRNGLWADGSSGFASAAGRKGGEDSSGSSLFCRCINIYMGLRKITAPQTWP